MIAWDVLWLVVVSVAGVALMLAVVFLVANNRRARPIEVKPGDDVVTTGGLAGRVVKIEGDWLRLRLTRERGGVHATVLRSAVVGRWEGERR
jgi:preprotein translocase subunit YajC